MLGWSLIADAIWRRGSGASKHTQTFTSRSLRLTLVSRWLPWKRAGVSALSQDAQCRQAAPELSSTLKPFLWSWLKPRGFPPAPAPPSASIQLDHITNFYRIQFKKPSPLLCHCKSDVKPGHGWALRLRSGRRDLRVAQGTVTLRAEQRRHSPSSVQVPGSAPNHGNYPYKVL